jgi:hypothetical protein
MPALDIPVIAHTPPHAAAAAVIVGCAAAVNSFI